jgi:hypothetical protein
VLAEDRRLLIQEGRYVSLLPVVDSPGLSAISLIASVASFKPSARLQREVSGQTGALLAAGRKGRAVLHDIDVYLQGINAYVHTHGHTLGPFTHVADFTRIDIYAYNALKDQFVGEGGGDEARRVESLAALEHRLGPQRGLAV